MDANLWFWTGALANMGVIVVLIARGWGQARRREFFAHRRTMVGAGALVLLFLISYAVKLRVLGSEDLGAWSAASRTNLYVHESFVAMMLVAAGAAILSGQRLARTRHVTGDGSDPPPTPGQTRRHRFVGRVAAVCAVFGFLTACGILAGMVARL